MYKATHAWVELRVRFLSCPALSPAHLTAWLASQRKPNVEDMRAVLRWVNWKFVLQKKDGSFHFFFSGGCHKHIQPPPHCTHLPLDIIAGRREAVTQGSCFFCHTRTDAEILGQTALKCGSRRVSQRNGIVFLKTQPRPRGNLSESLASWRLQRARTYVCGFSGPILSPASP